MEIKSITDVITNSSSEVFVIRYKKDIERKDIIKILVSLIESLDLKVEDTIDWYTETNQKGVDDVSGSIKTKKGDLIITPSKDKDGGYNENRIPLAICQFIKNFKTIDKSISEIRCWFSGIGLI